jgi:gas vesicle protein
MAHNGRTQREEREGGLADAGALILGGLVGAMIGAVIGIWNAPRSGAETRAEIVQRGTDLRTQAEYAAAEARERVEGPSADTLIAEAKEAARRLRN